MGKVSKELKIVKREGDEKSDSFNELNNQSLTMVIELINRHRTSAYRKVNEELVKMYFEVGKYLSEKVASSEWGAKVIDNIASEVKKRYPSLKGFDRRGLFRMMQFYETYKDNELVSPLVSQISWTNNLIIFSHKSSLEEKIFYIKLCIKNNYSKRELERQINSQYYERYVLSGGNASLSSNKLVGEDDYPNTRILDLYSLTFMDFPNNYKEKDLRDLIIENMKDFILEIGKDFTFIGKEYRISVGNSDYYIDLLFYNRSFNCLVAFELKVGKFEPEFVSKMSFYLEALDRLEKHDNENPSIGVILCTEKNDSVVEFAMARNISPIAISEYTTKLIDKKLLKDKLIEYKNMFSK